MDWCALAILGIGLLLMHNKILPAAANPMDLANMMAASIEAALKPLRKRLEATMIPMQRTIESLQAEFVALRGEKNDEVMPQTVSGFVLETQEANRLRNGNIA